MGGRVSTAAPDEDAVDSCQDVRRDRFLQQVVNLNGIGADIGGFGETLDLMVPDSVVGVPDLEKQEVCVHGGRSEVRGSGTVPADRLAGRSATLAAVDGGRRIGSSLTYLLIGT